MDTTSWVVLGYLSQSSQALLPRAPRPLAFLLDMKTHISGLHRDANRTLVAVLVIALLYSVTSQAEPPKPRTPDQLSHFQQKVLPILKANCFKCHGEDKTKGGLQLTSRDSLLNGGDSGPAINVKTPSESRLIHAVSYNGELKMPPTGKLSLEHIKTLEEWVKAGAPWPTNAKLPAKETQKHPGGLVTPESKNYWAYRPVARPKIPAVRQPGWVRNPIDAFILSKLEDKGLAPNSAADRLALIRRVTYDLIGLPPTPEEVDTFVSDTSSVAYEKLIDRLLASPHYGEKWGRHWLDVVRYAETNGYERDGPKPFAWRFRDYVIKSLNDDKPFDQFVREQLAGDEKPGRQPDAIIATGYYRLGLWDDEPSDPKQARFDELDDIVATTSQAFLGMTMNCARCHEHKIDPIPQADYYRLLAFFADISPYSNDRNVKSPNNLTDITPPARRALYEMEYQDRQRKIEQLERQMARLEEAAVKKMPEEDQRAAEGLDRPAVVKKVPEFLPEGQKEEYQTARTLLGKLKKLPEPDRELALSINRCKVNPPQTFVMLRGSAHAPGRPVSPGFPTVLTQREPKLERPAKDAVSSGRRTVLADWIASKENPLTARVFVNRLWQGHFGRGIVASSNDFGQFGTPPTHPELLDWLAWEFMAGDWKIKRLHKLILLSNTYQISSRANDTGLKTDPDNNLFWRFNMRRLTAEEVRDSILAVSGKLNLRMYGPSIYPKLPKEVLAGQSMPGNGWPTTTGEESDRRSIYIHVKRSLQVPILATHDQADTDNSCPVRYTTTVPTQALGLLNGEFSQSQAESLAIRLRRERPNDVQGQVRLAVRLTTGRQPSNEETRRDVSFIELLRKQHRMSEALALKQYALLILNANEFVYLD